MLAGTIIVTLLGVGLIGGFLLMCIFLLRGLWDASREERYDRKVNKAREGFKTDIANAQNIPVVSHVDGPKNISFAQWIYQIAREQGAPPDYLSDLHLYLAGKDVPRFDNDPSIMDWAAPR